MCPCFSVVPHKSPSWSLQGFFWLLYKQIALWQVSNKMLKSKMLSLFVKNKLFAVSLVLSPISNRCFAAAVWRSEQRYSLIDQMVVNLSLLSYNWLIIMLDEHSCIDKVHNCTFRFKCKKDKPLLQTDLWCFCTMISFVLASFQYIKALNYYWFLDLKKKGMPQYQQKNKTNKQKTTIKN